MTIGCFLVLFLVSPSSHALIISHHPVKAAARRRVPSPVAIDDGVVVLAAAALMAAAGALQYSVSAGDKGINAFLMKEKSSNPYYSKDYKSDKPTGGPKWLQALKLPEVRAQHAS